MLDTSIENQVLLVKHQDRIIFLEGLMQIPGSFNTYL
jgi:hypothetical protein